MDFVARLCDPVISMAEGTVLAEGTIDEVKNNEAVIESYLERPKNKEASASFLIGENMTGGYGSADILHDCTIGVEKGEIAVIAGERGR